MYAIAPLTKQTHPELCYFLSETDVKTLVTFRKHLALTYQLPVIYPDAARPSSQSIKLSRIAATFGTFTHLAIVLGNPHILRADKAASYASAAMLGPNPLKPMLTYLTERTQAFDLWAVLRTTLRPCTSLQGIPQTISKLETCREFIGTSKLSLGLLREYCQFMQSTPSEAHQRQFSNVVKGFFAQLPPNSNLDLRQATVEQLIELTAMLASRTVDPDWDSTERSACPYVVLTVSHADNNPALAAWIANTHNDATLRPHLRIVAKNPGEPLDHSMVASYEVLPDVGLMTQCQRPPTPPTQHAPVFAPRDSGSASSSFEMLDLLDNAKQRFAPCTASMPTA